MTSAEVFLRIPSFRSTVEALADIEPAVADRVRAQLGRTVVNDGAQSPVLQPDRERAFQILYDAASDDGLDEVIADIRKFAPSIETEGLRRLENLIRPDVAANNRIEGSRQRDAFLPVLRSLRTALDLRLVTLGDGDYFLPVVTMRLQFDEASFGSADAAVFQVPLPLLRALAQELAEVVENLPGLKDRLAPDAIPDWAFGE